MHFHMIPTKRKLILFKNKFMESKSVFLVTWPPSSTGRGRERTSDLPHMALSAFCVLSQLFLTAVLGIVLLAPFCLWKTVSKVLTNSSGWTGISSGANAHAASMEHALFKAGVVPFFLEQCSLRWSKKEGNQFTPSLEGWQGYHFSQAQEEKVLW